MSGRDRMLITFAWTMEIIGVTGGLINSTYTTFGADLPDTFVAYVPAVPMVALTVAELDHGADDQGRSRSPGLLRS
jgi:hypothetical protein